MCIVFVKQHQRFFWSHFKNNLSVFPTKLSGWHEPNSAFRVCDVNLGEGEKGIKEGALG